MFFIIMIVLLLLSIFSHIMIGVLYQKMIKEAENMQLTEDYNLKTCMTKFSNFYRINAGITNIPVFVDQYLNHMRLGPIPMYLLNHIPGQFVLLTVFLGGLGACREIIEGATIGDLLPYYMISLLGLYVYFSVIAIVDIPNKMFLLKTNIVEYLENEMLSQLKKEKEESKTRRAMERELQKELQGKSEKKQNLRFTKTEEQELEDLLKEFLA